MGEIADPHFDATQFQRFDAEDPNWNHDPNAIDDVSVFEIQEIMITLLNIDEAPKNHKGPESKSECRAPVVTGVGMPSGTHDEKPAKAVSAAAPPFLLGDTENGASNPKNRVFALKPPDYCKIRGRGSAVQIGAMESCPGTWM